MWTIIIGILAGFFAGKIVRGKGYGLIINLVVGVIGSYTGSVIFNMLGLAAQGKSGALIMSTIGAIAFLSVLRIFR